MTIEQKIKFIEEELYHELRCLLGAATVWQIFKNNGAGFDVVVAMDSAFVHTRNLSNFFTKQDSGDDISITEFGPSVYESPLYTTWEKPLHRHVIHISKGRVNPTNYQNDSYLYEQVANFAKEILLLWDKFSTDPKAAKFAFELTEVRVRAIKDSSIDAQGRTVPLFNS